MSDKSCRTDSEFELHFRQSLLNFEVRTPGAGVSRLLSALWQQVVTVLQVKAARSITSKPHGGASLGAGNSELKCDDDVAHPDEHVSEFSIRGAFHCAALFKRVPALCRRAGASCARACVRCDGVAAQGRRGRRGTVGRRTRAPAAASFKYGTRGRRVLLSQAVAICSR